MSTYCCCFIVNYWRVWRLRSGKNNEAIWGRICGWTAANETTYETKQSLSCDDAPVACRDFCGDHCTLSRFTGTERCCCCCCASGFRRARHRSQRDHHQSGVLVPSQRRGQREGESRQRSGGAHPRRHSAGGADRTCQVAADTHAAHCEPAVTCDLCSHQHDYLQN